MSPRLAAVRAVIFDVDGTLADSVEHYYRIACDIVTAAGAPAVARDRVLRLMGRGDPDLVRKLLPEGYPDVESTVRRIVQERQADWRQAAAHLAPIAGVVELLHDLDARGFRLGIATSSNRALPFLDRWEVRHVFAAIVGREDVAHRKPDPEGIERCLADLGAEPGEAAYVGDSPIDIEAGRRAGVATIGVLTGTSGADVLEAAGADHVVTSAGRLGPLLPHRPGGDAS